MHPSALHVKGVSHRYQGFERDALPLTNLAVQPGERILLVGPNGAGKTTLLYRIVGLLQGPGQIEIGDTHVSNDHATLKEVRRMVGFLWQNPDDALLLPTVREDVAFGPLNDGLSSAQALEKADQWLQKLGIAHLAQRSIYRLSLGEKQLVSLAGVLAREPGLIILDEPTAYLDTQSKEALATSLDPIGATQVIATHDPNLWQTRGRPCRVVPIGKAQESNGGGQ